MLDRRLKPIVVEWLGVVNKMKHKNLVLAGTLVFIIIVGIVITSNNGVEGTPVTMYKSPTCGCCVGHAGFLENNNFDVEIIPSSNLEIIKSNYNIPSEMRSCHTSVIGDYFIEGHMPLEAINKLLAEQPDIDGIALPGMPTGSPGMPGAKSQEWIIYQLKDGVYSEFMRI